MGIVRSGCVGTGSLALAVACAVLPGLAAAQPANGQRNAFGVPDAPGQADPAQPYGPAPFTQPAYDPPPFSQPSYPSPSYPAPSYGQPSYGPPARPAPPQYGQAPPQPFQQAPLSAQQYLAGMWHGTTNDGSGGWEVFASFSAEGNFVQQQLQQGQQGMTRLALMGRYDAQLGPDGGTLTLYPVSWEPRQVCQGAGNCRPVNMPPNISIGFRPMSRDMLQTKDGTFQRIGPAQ